VILLNPGTSSEWLQDNPNAARSFSFRKVINSLVVKRTNSLPVTPSGTTDKVSSQGDQIDNLPATSVRFFFLAKLCSYTLTISLLPFFLAIVYTIRRIKKFKQKHGVLCQYQETAKTGV
jgi:hypothetical protein